MKWLIVKLKNIVADIQPGFAQQPNRDGEGIPHLRTNNISEDGRMDLSLIKTVEPSPIQTERYLLRRGDVLFNNTNSAQLVGKTAFFEEQGQFLFSNHLTRIRVSEKVVNPHFLAIYLHWIWKSGGFRTMVTRWVNQAAINTSQLAKLSLSLPPLSEQRRIVELLDQADALRRKRAEAEARAERILPALFIKMFGDPATNPMGWETRPISEMGRVTTGNTPPRNNPKNYGDFIEWIKSDNLNSPLGYVTTSKECLSKEGARIGRIAPKDSTLITCIAGSHESIGKAALTDRDVAFNQQINAVTPFEDINPYFLYGAIKLSKSAIQALSSKAMKGLVSKSQMEKVMLICPPRELQNQFATSLVQILQLRANQVKATEYIDSCFQLLLHRAFSGDLTAQWREARLPELLAEMEEQVRLLNQAPVQLSFDEVNSPC